MSQRRAVSFPPGQVPQWRRMGVCCLLLLLLSGCASNRIHTHSLAELPPLQFEGEVLELSDVGQRVVTPDLLALDDSMRSFVETYTEGVSHRRQRLQMLHRAISGSATLGMEYDPFAEGTAQEAFHRQTANCLSYANMFIALAREAGLNARYQWVDVRPTWTRMGERVAVRLHVNAVVHLGRRDRYMVDLDPLPARDIAGSQELSDSDAQALHHNNIAMAALAKEQMDQAWLHAMRALQLSPQMSSLWVNLGVIYRRTEQFEAAELAYLQALDIDNYERSAMNNLMLLYEIMGRQEEYAYWQSRVDGYRDTNPYYHAWLGDQAAEEGDWRQAKVHYGDAIDLDPNDADLLFSMGLIYSELGQPKAALRYVEMAMDNASLQRERRRYRAEYDRINNAMLAVQ